ncbi:MAG: glycosyltransferase family 2 protein [Candidatus Dojkabacteria bacterium]|uniref:Glycosyltransferase family 2 protein n=2 Tax=Candidatus Dojkabacteria TaxID=74243 RepID=A0A952AIL5_9BACT|nr:glycosyltransferase family 2 protein [Candidatus Dojkabacteria bacterium]WKZ27645.1 MAG: glycosyltransferase family 2 protein [Candidatus Dojkabacteria bacterium]
MLKIRQPEISIIIPVWNEIKTVEHVVRTIHELDVDKEIIVIDDYSTDGSRELLKKLQPELRLKLILHAKNKGKGAAVLNGAAHAKGKYMIVEDADSELDPQDILRMLHIINTDKVDMVAGSRLLRDKVNFVTKLARFITRIMLFICFGRSIKDPLCAYKLCKLNSFKSLHIESERFGLEIEWVVKALKKKWKIKELDIEYFPRGKKDGKKINLKDGIDIMSQILRLRFNK